MRTRFVLAGLALASACAGPVYEGRYPYEHGWRIGKVTQVAAADAAFRPTHGDCRASLSSGRASGRVFVRVTFQSGRRYLAIIARAAPGYAPRPGDSVYVNAQDCGRDVERAVRGEGRRAAGE